MRTLLLGARFADADMDLPRGWLLVEGGRIADLGGGDPPSGIEASRRLDLSGLLLMPAFVDLHVHFRDPGFPEKESLESGCLAAAAGGYGTVLAMANTRPAVSDLAAALGNRDRARALGRVDLFQAISLSRDLEGRDISHLDALEEAGPERLRELGILALSEDGKDLADEDLMLKAYRKAARLGLLVSAHCELPGARDSREAEIEGVMRAIRLARAVGLRLHLAHLSLAASLALAREAKNDIARAREAKNDIARAREARRDAALAREQARPGGSGGRLRISAEASPHHIALCETDALRLGAAGPGAVNPPLRSESDRAALLEALLDGTVDAIATDHAPHRLADKEAGAPGFSGLETAYALVSQSLSLWLGQRLEEGLGKKAEPRLISRLMSAAPAEILGLADRGRLKRGLRADLTAVDEGETWILRPEDLKTKGKNSPLIGRALVGKPKMTMLEGRISHDEL